ncbi:MAG: DUF2029 domain-containing protein [Deltaproteobacteria bacterium]|nr:DUF2029 domain-containing protein [Deltaproteobacteria bacterium]
MRAILLAGLGTAQAVVWLAGLGQDEGTRDFAWRAALLFALQAAGLWVAWNRRDRTALAIVLFFALVFRAAAWTWPPELSSDLYRYVWDGRVQMAGESPYRRAPADPALSALRDDAVWPRINRPEARTVYPPGAQAAYLALAAVGGGSVRGVKTAAALADLAVLALLVAALRRRGLPAARVAIHAWSPLVVSEVCVSGHVDALAVLLVMIALGCADVRRFTIAGAVLGAAAAIKLYPILLLAALPRGKPRATAAAAALAVVTLAYVPYALPVGTKVLGFLPDYFRSGEDFNGGLRILLEALLAPAGSAARPASIALCAVLLLGALVVIARRAADDVLRAAAAVALAFVMLLPTAIHPWYALWLVPLVTLRPSAAALWLAGALPLSYLKYGAPGERMPPWVLAVEWLPAFALAAFELLSRQRAGMRSEAT